MLDIYLDLNHFIALARILHGKEKERAILEPGRAIIAAVREGRVRLPLSRLHVLESAKDGNEQRRHRLIDAFAELSGGWVVKPAESLTEEELLNWANGEIARASTAVCRGLLAAFGNLGVTPAEVYIEDALGDHPDAWKFVLKQDGWLTAPVPTIANRYSSRIEEVRGNWLQLPSEKRKLVYAEGLLQDTIESLAPMSESVSQAVRKFGDVPPRDLPERLRQIPTLDVLLTLGEARARDKAKTTDPNDLWDMGFLTFAIPYFDIVVTEKTWSHLAKSTGLTKRFTAKVLSKLEDAAELIP